MTEHSGYDDKRTPLGERREPYLKLALASLAGPFCWVLHFALVYLLEGLFCIQDPPPTQLIIGTVIVATLAFGAACAWLIVKSRFWLHKAGGNQVLSLDFLVQLTRMLAGLSLLAIVWAATGSAFLSACSAVY